MTSPAGEQSTPTPHVLEQLRDLYRNQAEGEKAVQMLRAAGLNKLASIKLLRTEFHLPLAEAKRLVHYSMSWRDARQADTDLHDQLLHAALLEGFAQTAPPAKASLQQAHRARQKA